MDGPESSRDIRLRTPAQAAEYLAISERHLRRLVSERRIAYIKERHLVRFDGRDLDAWIEAKRIEALDLGEW